VELSGFSTTGVNTITISGIGSAYAPDVDRVGVVA
jgi:alpha-galactosidase